MKKKNPRITVNDPGIKRSEGGPETMNEYNNYTENEKIFVATIIGQSRKGGREHSRVPGAIYLSCSELNTVFGDKYKSKTEGIWECVEEDYTVGDNWLGGKTKKGITKAYRWTEAGRKFFDSPEFKIQPGKKTATSREEHVNGLEAGRHLVDNFKYDPDRSDNFFNNMEDWRTCRFFVDHCDPETKINHAGYRRVSGKNGRQFASTPALQTLPRYFREIVVGDMTDVDIKNAHPTIALAFARREKLFTPNLELYVNQREKVLQSLMKYYGTDRDAVKELMLMATYLSYLSYRAPKSEEVKEAEKRRVKVKKFAYTEWCDEHQIQNKKPPAFLKIYQKELKELSKVCRKTTEAKQWELNEIKKENSFFSKFIQVIEDEFIQVSEQFFLEKDRELDALMFDGFMITGEVADGELRELEERLQEYFEKTYGMQMNLKLDKDYYNMKGEFKC